MRKYQQLVLLLISCFSIGVLLMYKSENNRLKYVLQVVNFFGRSDAAVLRRIEASNNQTIIPEFNKPLAVWQAIGGNESFHAYAAYWYRNGLISGGEAIALVVGRQGAVINFQCNLGYDRGRKIIQGKFRFQRADNETDVSKGKLSSFTSYYFYCRITRDFGRPESVTFIDRSSVPSKTGRKLRLRHLRNTDTESAPLAFSACVDLVNYNSSSRFADEENNLLQFFLFHQAIGIQHFIVYDYDELPSRVAHLLQRTNLQMYHLPFNFPFAISPTSSSHLRRLIEIDCLLRNVNQARNTVLLAPNEFVFLNSKDGTERSIRHFLKQFRDSRNILPSFSVCMDDRHKLLMDNTQYDADGQHSQHNVYFYNLGRPVTELLDTIGGVSTVSVADGFVHRYTDCQKVGPDGLKDWRTSVREDFMNRIKSVKNEIDLLI